MPGQQAAHGRDISQQDAHYALRANAFHNSIRSCAELMSSESFLVLNRIATENSPESLSAQQSIKAALHSLHNMTTALLKTAQDEGFIETASPEEAAEHLIALIIGRTSNLHTLTGGNIDKKSIDTEASIITKLFLNAHPLPNQTNRQ